MSKGLTPTERAERLARYYDLDFLDISYDAELYQQLAQEAGGPVLELGVGSGRVAIPLALAGHHVVGIDHDPAMLRRANDAWEKVRGQIPRDRFVVREGDFACVRSEERFGLALIAVNTFLLAEDDGARISILETMRSHLRPGGLAAVEISTPDAATLATYDRRLQHEWLRTDPETDEEVSKHISAHHDPRAATLELTQVYEWTPAQGGPVSRVSQVDLLHLVSADELAVLARAVGFAELDLRGDHLATPYGVGSHRVILVARLV